MTRAGPLQERLDRRFFVGGINPGKSAFGQIAKRISTEVFLPLDRPLVRRPIEIGDSVGLC
jgi:hypothetical protein